jgi:protein-S-isoprenylcysteine O-methyltransferase Ste14
MIILIFLSFAFIHSITVSQRFKQLCQRKLGETFMRVWYRFLYNAMSGMTAVVAFSLIYQVPDKTIWIGPLWFRWSMHAIQLGGLIFGARAFEHLDTAEFMGFRQVWRYFTKQEISGNIEGLTQRELVTTGVYGIVRHPMYLAGIIIFTFEPNITVTGLIVTILADLYFLFGSFIEERRFIRTFGDQYREYRERVPRLVPFC